MTKAVCFLNMGGPKTTKDVRQFLLNLFSDQDIIKLPFQKYAAPFIVKRRSPKIEQQYHAIGGGSPILDWTRQQGKLLESELLKEDIKIKTYVGFRYTPPYTHEMIQEMKKDGITEAIAFSQYPQYSCSTTGSSINELYRQLIKLDPQKSIQWSIIDRWYQDPFLIKSFQQLIQKALNKHFDPKDHDQVVVLFSAHSLPLTSVLRGDPYTTEVSATSALVMESFNNPWRVIWQSKVGPKQWMAPATDKAIHGYLQQNRTKLLIVPIAFTSDHIETLYELDEEYIKEANDKGFTQVHRTEALNIHPTFIKALANQVLLKLKNPTQRISNQFSLRCPHCVKSICKDSKQYFQ